MDQNLKRYFQPLTQQKEAEKELKDLKQKITEEMQAHNVESLTTNTGKMTISKHTTKILDNTKVKLYFSSRNELDQYLKESVATVFTATPTKSIN